MPIVGRISRGITSVSPNPDRRRALLDPHSYIFTRCNLYSEQEFRNFRSAIRIIFPEILDIPGIPVRGHNQMETS